MKVEAKIIALIIRTISRLKMQNITKLQDKIQPNQIKSHLIIPTMNTGTTIQNERKQNTSPQCTTQHSLTLSILPHHSHDEHRYITLGP